VAREERAGDTLHSTTAASAAHSSKAVATAARGYVARDGGGLRAGGIAAARLTRQGSGAARQPRAAAS
jgi:hypothetical protein